MRRLGGNAVVGGGVLLLLTACAPAPAPAAADGPEAVHDHPLPRPPAPTAKAESAASASTAPPSPPLPAPSPAPASRLVAPADVTCRLTGPPKTTPAEWLPKRYDSRITAITVGRSASLRGSWLNTHNDPIATPVPGPVVARATFVEVFDPDARVVTRTMSTTLLQDIQKGSHGSSWTWGAFGGATEAPVLSRFYGKTDGWTLSFDVAFVWFPGSLPSVNRTSAIANPENVSSAVRTRDGHVRGLAVDLSGDIESTDRGELARYLGTDVSALAIDVKGDLAVVHLPPDGLPPSANAPITLTPIELGPSWTDAKKGKVSSMAPFAKLEPDDSPSCQAARKGFRSILATHGWLRLQVDGTASADNDELLLVRFEEGRLCLEAAEVVPTGDDHILPLDQAFVNLAPYVVVRFSGQPSAAQLQFARDGVTRRPASCALESP